jgi:hypothetical protein
MQLLNCFQIWMKSNPTLIFFKGTNLQLLETYNKFLTGQSLLLITIQSKSAIKTIMIRINKFKKTYKMNILISIV